MMQTKLYSESRPVFGRGLEAVGRAGGIAKGLEETSVSTESFIILILMIVVCV